MMTLKLVALMFHEHRLMQLIDYEIVILKKEEEHIHTLFNDGTKCSMFIITYQKIYPQKKFTLNLFKFILRKEFCFYSLCSAFGANPTGPFVKESFDK